MPIPARLKTHQEVMDWLRNMTGPALRQITEAIKAGNLQASIWTIEQVVGKPRVRVSAEVSADIRGELLEHLSPLQLAAIRASLKALATPAIDAVATEVTDTQQPHDTSHLADSDDNVARHEPQTRYSRPTEPKAPARSQEHEPES